jgi:predicted AAA+ superfamily ATPase
VAFTFSEDSGWLAENIVLNHLRRSHEHIFYGSNGGEVDFLVKEGLRIVQSIQVWQADPSETAIPARELAPFEPRLRSAGPGECLLITNDLERVEKVGKKEIRCVPPVLFFFGL